MEEPGATTTAAGPDVLPADAASTPRTSERDLAPAFTPQLEGEPCSCGRPGGQCVCGAADVQPDNNTITYPYVYAIGHVQPRFPSQSVEREFAQATGRAETKNLTDRQALHKVLSARENRYLARQLCYVLTIQGLETYILQPRDPEDVELLIDAIRRDPSPLDLDVVIGVRGEIAPPELCNGSMLPIVGFDQLYSFDRDALIKSIPRPEGTTAKQFDQAAAELLERMLQVSDNAGATDEHRALNYLIVRYQAIYATTADAFERDFALTGVEVLPSALSLARKVLDVIFSFTNRTTDFTERFFVRVDVTEEFPFVVSKMSPYFSR
jgi:PatG C-terminal